jgi:hypothetical protein
MACENSFTNGHIGLDYMPNNLEMPTCWAHSTSFPGIHRRNFSIFEKIIFLLLERVITIFIIFVHTFKFQCSLIAIWLSF